MPDSHLNRKVARVTGASDGIGKATVGRKTLNKWRREMPRFWDILSQGFSYLIILAATVMFGWGILGFLEYFSGFAPLMPLQNPTFPSGTQFVHWLLITLSGGTFLAGYILRWHYTPVAMMVLFASLATLCAVQTFDFMENESRYADYARECVYYIIMSIYLVRSKRMRNHFGQITVIGPGHSKSSSDAHARAGAAG